MLFVWVRSTSKMSPYIKFTKDKVLVFVILRENSATVSLTVKNAKIMQLTADWLLPISFAGSGHALIRQLADCYRASIAFHKSFTYYAVFSY